MGLAFRLNACPFSHVWSSFLDQDVYNIIIWKHIRFTKRLTIYCFLFNYKMSNSPKLNSNTFNLTHYNHNRYIAWATLILSLKNVLYYQWKILRIQCYTIQKYFEYSNIYNYYIWFQTSIIFNTIWAAMQ